MSIVRIWNGLDGLINDKPFMPGASPARQAQTLMDLAELDGERLGPSERRLVLEYAEAVRDYRSVMDLVNELSGEAHELQYGYVDTQMEGYIRREIAAADRANIPFAAAG